MSRKTDKQQTEQGEPSLKRMKIINQRRKTPKGNALPFVQLSSVSDPGAPYQDTHH